MRRAVLAYTAALVAATALFLLAPGLDLWASHLFYRPDEGFYLSEWAPVRLLYRSVPWVAIAQVIAIPLLLFLGWRRRRPIAGVDLRVAAYLLLTLALGPGLLVNTVFKDHWGRARPSQVVEFGGAHRFTAAPLPANQCARNCSFVAGHPAVGFALLAYAFLPAARRRRRLIAAGALAYGSLLGVVRLAQGGHFLSDVVFSGLLVGGVAWLLAWALLERDLGGALWRTLKARLDALGARWALYGTLTAVGVVLSVALVDRPVALFFHRADPRVLEVFQVITRLGISTYYLIFSAAVALALWLAVRLRPERQHATRLKAWASASLFLFLSIALSGIVTDLLKVVFGRARPKLLFANETFGFDWWGTRSDFWSFPSGHATTAVAIATALYCLWPRFLPLYIAFAALVSLSRVVVGAHYVSDVIFAAFIAIAATSGLRRFFIRRGLPLGQAGPPQ